FTKLFSIFATF
ncbi:RecBCD enzyme subunit RecC, partial [Haemophilus influenzae]